uniref:Serpin domain-containing protein n=1 Tax=Panagrolaimus sp. PS1159 TaxID=55785 RepID=A0AC35F3X2_9BILA
MSLESEAEFYFKLLPLLKASSNSTVFSPSSILNSLAIIYFGSDGNTAKQISDIIGKGKTEKEILKYYVAFVKRHKSEDKVISQIINKKKKDDTEEVNLPRKRRFLDPKDDPNAKVNVNIANGIFVSENVSLVPEFEELILNSFDAKIQSTNFAETEKAVEEINKFVSEKTKENIKEIVTAEDIFGKTSLILVNAIHFIGTWHLPFDKEDTKDILFNSNPPREISMMKNMVPPSAEGWNYQEGKDWQALGIPYVHCQHSFFIVLPKEKDGLSDLIKNFDFSLFKQCTKRQKISRTTHILIPIMEIKATIDLVEKLSNFGITDVFSFECNLSKMLQGSNRIEKALHKAIIKVDEKGTVASAANVFRAIPRSSGINTFNATHPFLYFITSNNGTKSMAPKDILFMGTFC